MIAADNDMIKHAVPRHFEGMLDDSPRHQLFRQADPGSDFRVPPLGTQEVRAYMMLLFVENSDLDAAESEKCRAGGFAVQFRQTWQGKQVDRPVRQSLHGASSRRAHREIRHGGPARATDDDRFWRSG